jgi:hypothetical protein
MYSPNNVELDKLEMLNQLSYMRGQLHTNTFSKNVEIGIN